MIAERSTAVLVNNRSEGNVLKRVQTLAECWESSKVATRWRSAIQLKQVAGALANFLGWSDFTRNVVKASKTS